MIVEIRPINEGDKWHGKTGSDVFSRPIHWPAGLDPNTRLYRVDLTDEDIEFFSKSSYDISVTPQWDEQGRLVPHPTWDTQLGTVELPRMNTKVLDTENVLDRLHYAVVKKCPLVAPSLEKAKDGSYPEAEFYIHSEELTIAAKEKEVAVRRNATKLSFEMTPEDKKNVIWILKQVDVTGKSDQFVDVLIEEIVNKEPKKFVQYGTMDKAEFKIMGMIHEAIYKGVLIKDGESILWGTEQIGTDLNDAIEYLKKDKNQPMRVRIMDQLNR